MKVVMILRLAMAAMVSWSAGAPASLLVIDSFNQPICGHTGSDTTLDNTYSVLYTDALTGQIATERTISQNLTANPQNVSDAVTVVGAGGSLIVNHGASANSLVKIDWTIGPFVAPSTLPARVSTSMSSWRISAPPTWTSRLPA